MYLAVVTVGNCSCMTIDSLLSVYYNWLIGVVGSFRLSLFCSLVQGGWLHGTRMLVLLPTLLFLVDEFVSLDHPFVAWIDFILVNDVLDGGLQALNLHLELWSAAAVLLQVSLLVKQPAEG